MEQLGRLFLPEGNSFHARVYDNFTVPFILGGVQPPLDSIDDIILCSNDSDLQIRGVSAYRGEFYFYLIQYYESGIYNFTLKSEDEVTLAEGALYITVEGKIKACICLIKIMISPLYNITCDNYILISVKFFFFPVVILAPTVEVVPPIAILLPTTTSVSLRCVPSIPNLPVRWSLSLGGERVIGETSELTLDVPQSGFDDGTEITCHIVDTSTKGRGRTVVSASATVRNSQSKNIWYYC